MICKNCGATLSCGCQIKVAKDGKSVCNNCLSQYNYSLDLKNKTTNLQTITLYGKPDSR